MAQQKLLLEEVAAVEAVANTQSIKITMDEETQKLIEERFNDLPEELQQAINSPETRELTNKIGKKYRLHADEQRTLENELFLVMLGLENTDDFPLNLQKETHLGIDDATAITREINDQLFTPLRTVFQKVYARDYDRAEADEEADQRVDSNALDDAELGIIENPLPAEVLTDAGLGSLPEAEKPIGESIAATKLDGQTTLPREERSIDDDKPLHEKINITDPQKNLYKGTDPYREQPDPIPEQ